MYKRKDFLYYYPIKITYNLGYRLKVSFLISWLEVINNKTLPHKYIFKILTLNWFYVYY